MPYPPQILDAEAPVWILTATASRVLTVGEDFIPGDMRVCFLYMASSSTFTTPTGWTIRFTTSSGSPWPTSVKVVCLTKTLTATSVDAPFTLSAASIGFYQAWTVRNPNLAQTLTATYQYVSSATESEIPWANVSVTANSVLIMGGYAGVTGTSATGAILTPPSATELDYNQEDDTTFQLCNVIYARAYTTAGSSGTNQADVFYSLNTPQSPSPTGSVHFTYCIVFQENPDVVATAGTATTETDTAAVATMSHLTTTTVTAGTALEVDTASQMFTPLTGYRISPQKALPQFPITNSVIHWEQSTPAVGSTVTVETSVDGGLTYQLATNDAPIPRLLPGTSVWQTVQTRVTLNRKAQTDPTPRVSDLEVFVATDASNDELVSLGLFTINDTDITVSGGTTGGSSGGGGGGDGVTGTGGGNTGGGLSIQISGVDLSRSISRNSWEDVYFVPSGTNYADAIQDIIEDRLPGTQYNFASTEHTTPKLIFGMSMDSDPWQDAQDLATAIGMELFFDAQGVCTLREVPDPGTGQSVWTFSDGANPTIASVTRSLTDQTVYNYITAYGESVDNAVPVSAVSFDDNPNSPTYYLGDYGKVPTSFTSPEITTVEQAQAAADALLNLSIGAAENVELSVVPMPAIEPGDVVTLTIGTVKVTGTFMVNDIETPLSAAEAQTMTVYRQTTSS
jgi:hypothetical protein